VRADRHLLARVLANLLSNGVKYSDSRKGDKATVIIGVVALPGRCRIDVVDNGIGIAESEQENVFKPFFQIANTEQDGEKGLGLGLSIVNAIVSTVDGHSLTMRSKLGFGTRFSVVLPRSSLGVFHIERANSESANVDVAGLYVLYVEDNKGVRKSTETLLREFGVLCDVSSSVEELVGKLPKLERMPDIVLTDYHLSDGTTAIDVVNAVYAEFQTRIPTIVLTGESGDFQYSEGMNGVVVLRKPISPKELLRQIRAAVS
jgi:CheY-like chemotaxis protein